ncbi:trans-sialidase, putative [Trypanosoma cruzi marinkellei]|uniref:Trans-sialidase, putative n=1 Tax=Trypanosoma cruzi marinkellei TaxID=85056 RepID=K2NHN9_TRYCR|nr:trans-sialidase, putative [Trypanosoma cruzi marinkellei]
MVCVCECEGWCGVAGQGGGAWRWRVAERAGTLSSRRSLLSSHPAWLVCVLLLFFAGDGSPCRPFRIVLCLALCVGALLCTPRTCLMHCRCRSPLHLLNTHARKESKQALNTTVKFEGSERTNDNSTHTAHTHIYMHSRVAAAMAPRTHNRRRVTGSSGRRREGGESERQRPNMSRRVFHSALLLLLIVWMCGAAGSVQAKKHGARADHRSGGHSLGPFQRGHRVANTPAADHTFLNPHLVNVNGMLVAITGALLNGSVGSESASMHLMAKISTDGGRTWQPYAGQVNSAVPAPRPSQILSPAPFEAFDPFFACVEGYDLKEDAMYRLIAKRGRSFFDSVIHFLEMGPAQARGLSMNSVSMSILFPYPYKSGDFLAFLNDASTPIMKMADNTLVFPVQFLTFRRGSASTIMYWNSDQKQWIPGKNATPAGCTNPSILEWEAGKIIMITSCKYGRRRVYESTDKGDTWKEALGTLSHVWSNALADTGLHVQSGFITATIGGRKVILLTQLEYPRQDGKGEIHLWLTDTNRIYHVGLLPTGESATSSSLLYVNDKLYCLYRASVGRNSGAFFLDLTFELYKVKDALSTWTANDNALRQCRPIAPGAAASGGSCSVPFPTAGLVSHLAGNVRLGEWKDEYLGVNAVVRGAAKKFPNGLTFEGHDAGAKWPVVDEQWPTRPLHFANYGFTLAATVSIHEEPTEVTPLMGLMRMRGTPLLGLSYDNNVGWILMPAPYPNYANKWELNQTYHVVLKMHDGVGSLYVDGKYLSNFTLPPPSDELRNEASHFYFGAYDQQLLIGKIHATVTNVFLYNRPLNDTEIGHLNANKVTIPPPKRLQAPASATSPSVKPVTTSVATKAQATAPAGSTITTSSAGEGTVNQLASGVPPSVASTEDGTQTVVTEGEGNMQGYPPTQASGGTSDAASANPNNAEGKGQDEPAGTPAEAVSSGEDGETAGGADGRGEIHPQDGKADAAALELALSSDLEIMSQGDNSFAGTTRESRVLPLLLLLGLWGLAAA